MIRISRESGNFDILRNYKIFIDDVYYDDIKDGEIKELSIDNGEHSIYLKIDWCTSNKLNFNVTDNQLIEFNCGNSMKGIKGLLYPIYITFLKNKYLFTTSNNMIS